MAARDLRDGQLVDVCIHCASTLDRRSPSARWLTAEQVEALGYFVDGQDAERDRHGGGGCRGGRCGVAQPGEA